jgi:hypothetical protein
MTSLKTLLESRMKTWSLSLFSALALAAGLSALGPSPAAAMCGGNIFMTCPPSPSSTKKTERKKREPRLRRHRGLPR